MKKMMKLRTIALAVLISLLILEAPLHAYVCAGREKAEADYSAAKNKIKEIQKERQLWTLRLQSLPAAWVNSVSDISAMVSLSKTCNNLDGHYNDEFKKAYWKWAQKKWGRTTTDWLPDLFKMTADYEILNKDLQIATSSAVVLSLTEPKRSLTKLTRNTRKDALLQAKAS